MVLSISVAPARRLVLLGNELCFSRAPLTCTGAVCCRRFHLADYTFPEFRLCIVPRRVDFPTLFVLGEIGVITAWSLHAFGHL